VKNQEVGKGQSAARTIIPRVVKVESRTSTWLSLQTLEKRTGKKNLNQLAPFSCSERPKSKKEDPQDAERG